MDPRVSLTDAYRALAASSSSAVPDFESISDRMASLPTNVVDLPEPSRNSSSTSSPDVATSSTDDASERPGNSKCVRPDTCAVCGSTATGYHYEVPSCDSCKTFFRRTLLRQRKYSCKQNGRCMEAVDNKLKFNCRACRYEGCVAAGMNPFAMVADIKAAKNPVVKHILSKRQLQIAKIEHPENGENSNPRHSKLIFHLTPTLESNIDRLVDRLLFVELKSEQFRRSSYHPPFHVMGLKDAILGHSKLANAYPDVDYSREQFPLPITNKWDYPEAPIGSNYCSKDDHLGTVRKPMLHAKNWRVMDSVVVIEYLKTLEFFADLDEADKKALVKGVTTACSLLLSAFYSYSRNDTVMRYPDGTSFNYSKLFPCCLLNKIPSSHSEMMNEGIIRMLFDSKLDRQEYVLLKALMICNHSIPELSPNAKRILATEKDRYAKSLFQYVMTHRGTTKGPVAYVEMLSMVNVLTRTANTDKDVHVYLKASRGLCYAVPLVDDICT